MISFSARNLFLEAGSFSSNSSGENFKILAPKVFAAITSSISILEAINSVVMDKFGWSRKKSCGLILLVTGIIALVVCLGYNIWYFDYTLPNGAVGQILDILDYVTNNIFMPVVAFVTCILVGWVVKPKTVTDEVKRNGEKFGRETLYNVMVKFVAPVCLVLIFLSAFGVFNNL